MRLSRQCGERLTRTGPPHKRRSAAESGLSEGEFHFMENQIWVLEMAYLRWKRKHGNMH